MEEIGFPNFFDKEIPNLLPKDGVLQYKYPFYTREESQSYFDFLMTSISWKQDHIRMFGKVNDLPRLTAWYGDQGKTYKYSGIKNEAHPWTLELKKIKEDVERYAGTEFNSVLLNLYRNGEDHLSWHADDERELGIQPIIASISFGATRKFQLKHKYEKELSPISVNLESGSLVIMKGEIQDNWLHRVAPAKNESNPRINLTFRIIS